jgi:hypothetical protein
VVECRHTSTTFPYTFIWIAISTIDAIKAIFSTRHAFLLSLECIGRDHLGLAVAYTFVTIEIKTL